MPIVPFDRRAHGAFVWSAFAAGSGEPRETLDDLFDQGARAAVVTGASDPDLLVSYAVVGPDPQTVTWVYTKPQARRHGLAKALLEHLGIDVTKPIAALFWAPCIPHLKRRGYVIVPPTKEINVEREQNEAR